MTTDKRNRNIQRNYIFCIVLLLYEFNWTLSRLFRYFRCCLYVVELPGGRLWRCTKAILEELCYSSSTWCTRENTATPCMSTRRTEGYFGSTELFYTMRKSVYFSRAWAIWPPRAVAQAQWLHDMTTMWKHWFLLPNHLLSLNKRHLNEVGT